MKLLGANELKPNTGYHMYTLPTFERVSFIETGSTGKELWLIGEDRMYATEDAVGNIFIEIPAAPKMTQELLATMESK